MLICASSLALATGARFGQQPDSFEVLKINKPEFFKNLDRPATPSRSGRRENVDSIECAAHNDKCRGKVCRPVQIIYFTDGKLGQTILADDHDFIIPITSNRTQRLAHRADAEAHADAGKGKSASTSERALIMRLRNAESSANGVSLPTP